MKKSRERKERSEGLYVDVEKYKQFRDRERKSRDIYCRQRDCLKFKQ